MSADDAIDPDALRASIAEVLAAECPTDVVLRHGERGRGANLTLWKTIAALGWQALGVPEAHGGLGAGPAALAVLYEELGRAVAPLPFLPTMLAAQSLATGADPIQQARWLPAIAAGAIFTAAPPAPLVAPTLRIESVGSGWLLSGDATLLDAADAAWLSLLAAAPDGRTMRVVMPAREPERRALWDHGHSLATVAFDREPVDNNAVYASAPAAEEALATHAAIALAAEAVGGSEAVLAITIDYLATRQQFGRPIGSFQALKHRVADHRARLEGSRLLLRSAVALAATDDPLAASEAAAAKALACADYAELARDAVQLHGGIGFTAEHPCHLYLNRARLNEVLFGDRERHVARAAAVLGLEVAG